jgi:hypothetical protein
MLNKCSNVSLATFRIALWLILANMAFLNSPNKVVKTLASPSVPHQLTSTFHKFKHERVRGLTTSDTRARQYPNRTPLRNRNIHSIDNILEKERHLHIQHLPSYQQT